MKPLYEYRIDEMAKLLPSDTGLKFAIYIDAYPRTTGHSGTLRIKFQNGSSANSTNWPSIALVRPEIPEFKIVGNISKVPSKNIEELKVWILQNYEALKELASAFQSPERTNELISNLKKFSKTSKTINESLKFDWNKYYYYIRKYNVAIGKESTIAGVNLLFIGEGALRLKPVMFIQNNFNHSFCKFSEFGKNMIPMTLEKEPQLLGDSILPKDIIDKVKKLIVKNLKMLLQLWDGEEYDMNVYRALKATR